MNLVLDNQPIWEYLDKTLAEINAESLAQNHLKLCQYQLNGYWDNDEFYDEIKLDHSLHVELTDSSLGKTIVGDLSLHWIKLKFRLITDSAKESEVGELTLVLNSTLELIDENWLINTESPAVIAIQKHIN